MDKESYEAHVYINYYSYVDCTHCGAENEKDGLLEPADEIECWNCGASVVVQRIKFIYPNTGGVI